MATMMMSSSTNSTNSNAAITTPSAQRDTLSLGDVSVTPSSVMDDFQVIFQKSNVKTKKIEPGVLTMKKSNRDAKEVAFRSLMASIQESDILSSQMGKRDKENDLDVGGSSKKVTFDHMNAQITSGTPSHSQTNHKKPSLNLKGFKVEDDDAISEITDNHTLGSHTTNRSGRAIPRLSTSMSNVVIPTEEDSIPSEKYGSKDSKSLSKRRKKKGTSSQHSLRNTPNPPVHDTKPSIPMDIPFDRNTNHNSGKFSSLSSQSLNSNQISSDSSGGIHVISKEVSNGETTLPKQLAKDLSFRPNVVVGDTILPKGESSMMERKEDYKIFPPMSKNNTHFPPNDAQAKGMVKSIPKDKLKQPTDATFPSSKTSTNESQKYITRRKEGSFSSLDLLSSPELFSQHVAIGIPLKSQEKVEVSKSATGEHAKISKSSAHPSNHPISETESLRSESCQDMDNQTQDNSYATRRVSHTQRHKQGADVLKKQAATHRALPSAQLQAISKSEPHLMPSKPSFVRHTHVSGTMLQSNGISDELSVEVSTETGNPLLTRYPRDRTINRVIQESSLSLAEISTSSIQPRFDESSYSYRDSYRDPLHTNDQDLVSLPLSAHEDLTASNVYVGSNRTDHGIWEAYRGDRYKAAKDFKTVLLGILCVLLVLGLCIVVAIVAIRQEKQPASPPKISHEDTKMAYNDLVNFLSSISSDKGVALQYQDSSQFRALSWLYQSDQHNPFWANEYRIIQRYVMATLYFNLGGENWLKQENWLSSEHECLWYSGAKISCTSETLTELDLSVNGLVGTIPEEIGLLTELSVIDLSRNDIMHTLPESLWNLKALESLRLNNNKLSGSLPNSMGGLSPLEILDLSMNQITGVLPNEIGKLESLRTLYLSSNRISGRIPSVIGKLSRLKELDIRTNSFSGDFPIEVFNLIGLEQLSLDQNTMNITELSTNIGSMVQLKSLRMEQCGLMGSIPTEIGGLTNLVTLSLHGNKMTGTIPDSIGNAKNLLYVNFSNNKLRGTLATELGLLRKIKVLDVSENELTGSIPGELSRLTTYQVELDLSRNKLTGSIPKDICVQSCCAMAIVNVDGNDVKGCESKVPCVGCSILGNGVSSNVLRNFEISSNYSLP